jgi:hypothetical protein
MTEVNKTQTPSFAQLITDIIDNKLYDLHTSMPAKIVSYDSATGMASVQPLIKRKFKNQAQAVDLPIINKVPVMFPRTATAFIHMPVAAGDVGHLMFSERSLDTWKTLGGSQDPKDVRKHDLTDCVFHLGGYPASTPLVGAEANCIHLKNGTSEVIAKNNGDITLKNGTSSIEIKATGKMKFQGAAAELLDELIKLIDADVAHTHGTVVGVSLPPTNAAAMTAVKAALTAMKV